MEELNGTHALAMSLLHRDNLNFTMMIFTLDLIGRDYMEALNNYDVDRDNQITLINGNKTIIIKIK